MTYLIGFLAIECAVLLGAYAAVVTLKILSGDINTEGLLKNKETHGLSPERVQALVITVAVSLYVASGISTSEPYFPEIPEEVLAVLFGSHVGYIGFKGKNLWFSSRH